jgi:hypothetical protein
MPESSANAAQTAATAELYRDEEWPPANDVSRVDIRFYTEI